MLTKAKAYRICIVPMKANQDNITGRGILRRPKGLPPGLPSVKPFARG